MPILSAQVDRERARSAAAPSGSMAQERGTSIDIEAFDKLLQAGPAQAAAHQVHRLRGREPARRRAAVRRRRHDRIRAVAVDGGGRGRPAPQARHPVRAVHGHPVQRHQAGRSPMRACAAPSPMRSSARTSCKVAFFGRGKPLEGVPIVEGTPWCDAELSRGWRYDPARCKGAAGGGRRAERLPDA